MQDNRVKAQWRGGGMAAMCGCPVGNTTATGKRHGRTNRRSSPTLNDVRIAIARGAPLARAAVAEMRTFLKRSKNQTTRETPGP